MCKDKKSKLSATPAVILSAMITIGAVLKMAGIHPMQSHLVEMGLTPYLVYLGIIEIIGASLFLLPRTEKIGLLLLTGYLGGAMAAEMPFHMIGAPAMLLALLWIAAFIRRPSQFIESSNKVLSLSKNNHL